MDGIFNIYKEKGFTSHDVVAVVRKTIHMKKVGHTGTLDPDAEGVLPICVGRATKLSDIIMDGRKSYRAVLRLGITTTTEDASGEILAACPVEFDEEKIRRAALSFMGKQEQIPPMYSAIKVNGKKLYELAREGKEIERKARMIEIYDIRIRCFLPPDAVELDVDCSKGTYIRTLCADIGKKLGCGAAMAQLKRTRAGSFRVEDSITLAGVEELMRLGTYEEHIIAPDSIFMDCEGAAVKREAERALLNGNKLQLRQLDFDSRAFFSDGDMLRVYSADREFRAVYTFVKSEGLFKPFKMFLE